MRTGGEGVPTSDVEDLFYFGSPGALNWVPRSQKELTEASRSQNELFYNCSTEYSHYHYPPHHSVESVELYCVCLSVCLSVCLFVYLPVCLSVCLSVRSFKNI